MIRKGMTALFALLLLAGCSGAREEQTDALRSRYRELESWKTTVQLTLPREEETAAYTLSLSANGEEVTLTVLSPEELEGMGATLAGENLQLRFDDLVLDGGTANETLNGFNAAPFVIETIRTGYLLEEGREEYGGEERLRLGLEGELNGAVLHAAVFFGEEGEPLFAEISENGKILARMEFTDFAFGAILSLE